MSLACQRGAERLKALGRAEQYPGTIAASALLHRDLPAQGFHLGGLERAEGDGFNRNQQTQRRIQRTSVALGPGRGEQAVHPPDGFRCEHRRALKERGCRGQAPAGPCPAGRPLKFLGDGLVGARHGLGSVPGAAVGIRVRVGGLRQDSVYGMRPGELRGLRWDHLDLDKGVIHVWRSARRGGDAKTPKSRRSLILPKRAVTALRAHRKRQAAERLTAGEDWHDNNLVFCHPDGRRYTRDNLNWRFACQGRRWLLPAKIVPLCAPECLPACR